jgi:hypothetical protein
MKEGWSMKGSGMAWRALGVLTALLIAGTASAQNTWNGSSDGAWTNPANWSLGHVPTSGEDVVVPSGTTYSPELPAGTNPPAGAYNSFWVQSGQTVTCLGDTGVVNYASGGTTNNPHGGGVTINTGSATIDGSLDADGQGFPTKTGPGAGTGHHSPGAHGGIGYRDNGSDVNRKVYGSIQEPTALGSGASGGVGGGAIKVNCTGGLTVDGEITADAPNNNDPGTGGSIWLVCSTFAGSGEITADSDRVGRYTGSSGGRVSIEYSTKTFDGVVSVSGSFANPRRGQPGTLWEPKKFDGLEGAAGSPVNVTLSDSRDSQNSVLSD